MYLKNRLFIWLTMFCFIFSSISINASSVLAEETENVSPLRQSTEAVEEEKQEISESDKQEEIKKQSADKEKAEAKKDKSENSDTDKQEKSDPVKPTTAKTDQQKTSDTTTKKDESKKEKADKDEAKAGPRKSKASKEEKDASFLNNLLGGKNTKQKEHYDLDYSPSTKKDTGKTPFYKHWIFWTVIGAVAITGTVLGIKYGTDSSDSMSFNVERRQ